MRRDTRKTVRFGASPWLIAARTVFGVMQALGCVGKVTLFEVRPGEAGQVETAKRPNGETSKQVGEVSDSLEEDPRWELLDD